MKPTTKENGMDFEDWYDEFRDAMNEEGMGGIIERRDAKRLYDKNYTPQRAAQGESRFLTTGEW